MEEKNETNRDWNAFLKEKEREIEKRFSLSEKLLRNAGFSVTYASWWEWESDDEEILETYPYERTGGKVSGYSEIRIFKGEDTSDETAALCETFCVMNEGAWSGEGVDAIDGERMALAEKDADYLIKNPRRGLNKLRKRQFCLLGWRNPLFYLIPFYGMKGEARKTRLLRGIIEIVIYAGFILSLIYL